MSINLNDLTLGQIKELAKFAQPCTTTESTTDTLNGMLGKFVIVRTYSAGVWFGELAEKAGKEVILKNARRMWRWWAAESISLSGVALYGIKENSSKIIAPVEAVWLEAIEIIPCTKVAIDSIKGAAHVKPE